MDYLIGVVVAVLGIIINIAGWMLVRRIAGPAADVIATGSGSTAAAPVAE